LDGTLGLVYADGYFATTGHSVGEPGEFVGQPSEADMAGMVEANYVSEGVDIALVRILAGVTATINEVWIADGETQTVTFENEERPEEGEVLWLQGAQTGRVGCSVVATDVDITEPNTGQQVNHVVLLDLEMATQPGDSGAPVIGEGNNACYGIYGGRVVVDGTTYGWFSPFENLTW
jgi:hypothetical protein